jgi:MFS transporter, MHS family, proline/betaine transporter
LGQTLNRPFIATWLIGVTGSNLAPSYYLIAAAAITFLVVLRIPETAFETVALILSSR